MPRLCQTCNRDYLLTEQRCPHCLANNPEYRPWGAPSRAHTASTDVRTTNLSRQSASIVNSVQSQVADPSGYKPYVLGARQATTTVTTGTGVQSSFTTADNMHSEMRALQNMLSSGEWSLYGGSVVRTADASSVPGTAFNTGEPHCGYCTVVLQLLGLPLTKPSTAKYNLSSHNNYPLPDAVKKSPYVLAKFLSGGDAYALNRLKAVLDSAYNAPSDKWLLRVNGTTWSSLYQVPDSTGYLIVDWDNICQDGTILNALWTQIWKSVASYLDSHKK